MVSFLFLFFFFFASLSLSSFSDIFISDFYFFVPLSDPFFLFHFILFFSKPIRLAIRTRFVVGRCEMMDGGGMTVSLLTSAQPVSLPLPLCTHPASAGKSELTHTHCTDMQSQREK